MTEFWERLASAPAARTVADRHGPGWAARCIFPREQWETHILPNHYHLAPYRDLLINAIEYPLFREWEEPDESSRFSVRFHAELPPDDHFPSAMLVRVVVKYLYPPFDPRSLVGLISTAYLMHLPTR